MSVCAGKSGRVGLAAVLALALCVSGCSKDPEVQKQQHFSRGQDYLTQKKYNEAIIELRNAVQIDPRFGEARYTLAEAYSQIGDSENAFREYVRAADLLKDPKVQLKAGTLLLLGGHFDEAKARAEQVLAAEPANSAAHILRGNALAGMKDFDAAVEQMQQAIKTDPNAGLSYATLGNFELQRGHRADADAAYAKAIELAPTSAPAHVALGNYRLAVGEREPAEAAFLRALELEPQSVMALRSLVTLYLTSRELAKAEPILLRLVELSKDSTPGFVLADLYAATGRPGKAIDRLQLLQRNPADVVPAKLRLANIDYTAGRKAEGFADLEAAITAAPKAPQAYVMKARFLIAEQRLDEAVPVLQAAIKAAPDYPSAQFWLAQTYLRQRKIDEATRAFTETLTLSPKFVPAQIALSSLALQARDYPQAISYATQAVNAAPREPDARAALIRALLAQKSVERARAELATLQADFPDLAVTHVLRGAIDMMGKDSAAAERAFARALEIDPASYDALNGLVATQMASGNVEAAQARIDAAVAKAPADAMTLLIAARAQLAARNFPAAEASLRKAIEADPQRLEGYTMLGRLYASQRRLDEAVREFEEIAKRQPNSVSAHTAVATLQLALNRRAEAKARYQLVLDLDANAAVAANNLAWMQAEDGDNLDVALKLAQTAVARLPASAEVSDTLGYVYLKKGLYPLAIGAFQASLKLDPRNPIYHYHLGLSYARSGDTPQARQALDAALKLNPGFAGAEDARATLASLQ